MSRNNSFDNARPVARTDAMIVEELDGDLIIYDTASNKAHALNPLAARIWKLCDGRHSVSELADMFAAETPDGAVVNCLAQLERLHLLNDGSLGGFESAVLSRRQLLRKVAIGTAAAAVMVPMVTSILAPNAMATASCQALNADCTGGKPCCAPLVCSATTGKCINPP